MIGETVIKLTVIGSFLCSCHRHHWGHTVFGAYVQASKHTFHDL